MAKLITNDKRFLVMELSQGEAKKCGFGITFEGKYYIVCGCCNEELDGNMYYIAGLNEVYCKDCYEDIIKNIEHPMDDESLDYELAHFNNVARIVGVGEVDSTVFMTDEEMKNYYEDSVADEWITRGKDEIY